MSDSIYLEIGDRKSGYRQLANFISYTVESDLYVADHAFSVELGKLDLQIKPGMEARLYVNDQLELTGIIERRFRRCDKEGRRTILEGRDLMGLVVDSYCEDFRTVEGMKLSQLAELLLKDVPFINRKKIVYQKDLVGRLKTRRSRDTGYGLEAIFDSTGERVAQIHAGMTKFQVLQMYALSRGQMFYSLPDGTFVFGRPRVGGTPEFDIIFNEEGSGVNCLTSEIEENIARRWSKVTVVAQRQARLDDGLNFDQVNVGGKPESVNDPTFPFYKPFVQLSRNDSQSPKQHARLLLEKMRYDGERYCYEMPGHSQNGKNFGLNRLARVKDTVNEVDGTLLISGRTYRLNKENGRCTTLKLSPPGLVEDGSKGGRR